MTSCAAHMNREHKQTQTQADTRTHHTDSWRRDWKIERSWWKVEEKWI